MRSVVLALALLVVAATACFGAAAADNNTSGAPDPSADNPQLGAAIASEDHQAQREHRRRATPEAEAQRARSRRAFRDQSSGEAADVARAHFGEVFNSRTWRGLTLRSGDRIDHFLDDSSYVLDQEHGPNLLVRSAAPLREVDQTGHKAPIDTTLQDDGAALTPANSPEPARIGKHLADGLRLERSQVAVTLAGSSENPSAQTIDDKAFYANALPQTDFSVASVPDGVETLLQLRSQDSPETSTLHFDLPAGAELQQSQDPGSKPGTAGSVDIVKDGKPIASVSPPVAFDADHQPVPASYAVDGNDVVLTVPHRSGDWRYPILVDPYVIEYFHWNDGGGDWLDRWAWGRTRSTFSPFDCTQNSVCNSSTGLGGRGLYMEAQPGTYTPSIGVNYTIADRGEWSWQAPNALSIVRVDWNYGYTPSSSCAYGYILGPGSTTEGGALVNCSTPTTNSWATSCTANTDCSTQNSTPSNYAMFGVEVTNSISSPAWVQLRNVQISLWDSFRPIIGTNPLTPGPPTGWVDDVTHSFQLRSTDQGSGIQKITFKHPSSTGTPLYDTRTYPCVGDPRNGFHCPLTIPWYANEPYDAFSYRTTDLPEGVNDFAIADADIVGNPTTGPPTDPATGVLDSDPRHFDSAAQQWQVKVDRSAPVISDSGSLKASANQRIGDGRYNLDAGATDGSTNSPAAQRSGVKSVEIDVDGVMQTSQTQTCAAGSCPLTLPTWTFVTERYAAGEHTISVVAKDQINHSQTDSWKVTVSHAASAGIGPGSVNLKTGNFTLGSSGAAVDTTGEGLEVGRTYNSRDTAGGTGGPFGPGWVASLPVSGPTSDFVGFTPPNAPSNPNAEVATSDGANLEFAPDGNGGFTAPVGSEDLKLTNPSSSEWDLTDLDGNVTVFQQTAGKWLPTQVREAGGSTTTRLVYDSSGRIQSVTGPPPTAGACDSSPLSTKGCRTLTFSYAASGTTPAPGTLGDYGGQITHVDLTAWDPSTGIMAPPESIAQYQYDSNGRLRAEWDPRIAPALKTTYDYDSAGHLTTLTPPGEAAWTMTYGTIGSDPDAGRLKSVSRTGPNGTATTTVAYGVPLSGSGAPYQMGSSNVSTWGQSDAPVEATAIFPPDQVPGDPPTSYTRATVHYMDDKGREVNTAEPGGHISTTEYDTHDDAVRTLGAANRERVLAGSASASQVDTQRTYNLDGTELQDEIGPLHTVQLASGEHVSARSHTHSTYDEGAPTGGPYHLATTVTSGAQISGRSDADVRTTKMAYDGQSGLGWTLRQPTSTTADSGGLNLTTTTLYDATTGQATESRMPANPNGADAHATQTIYYSATSVSPDPACASRPEWVNLPCKTQPAGQPNTPGIANIPITTYTYNRLNQVAAKTETVGGASRTTSFQYDGAGRTISQGVTASDGTAVPPVTTTYDAATGDPATTSATDSDGVTRTITRTYDSLGRSTSYTDADGNTSTTSYDLLDRPVTTNDGKGTQTRSYDSTTGLPTGLTDSAAGSFSATYDGDGQLVNQDLPNGLRQQNSYDETGALTHRSYVKTTNCSSNAPGSTSAATGPFAGSG